MEKLNYEESIYMILTKFKQDYENYLKKTPRAIKRNTDSNATLNAYLGKNLICIKLLKILQ